MSIKETAGVLDAMVAATMGTKGAAAAPLTPVGTETRALPADYIPGATAFVLEHVEEELVKIELSILGIRNLMTTDVVASVPADAKKVKEKTADARVASGEVETVDFDAQLAAKQAAAQAATFKAEAPAWECPQGHGAGDPRTNKRGRTYHVCLKCGDFERLAAA